MNRKRNARIWVHHAGGPVKLTIRPGQTLHWTHFSCDEEGYSREATILNWDGEILVGKFHIDGRDCDGRTSRSGECYTTPENFRAYQDSSPGCDEVAYPKWETISRGQRDYAAEAAGY